MKKLLCTILTLFALSVATPAQTQMYATDIIMVAKSGIWSDTRAYASLSAAITDIGADEQTLLISTEATCTTLTIPINVKLKFVKNGAINNSGVLTLQTRDIQADDNRQIFTGVGAIAFADGSVVNSTWFASTYEAFYQTQNDRVRVRIRGPTYLYLSVAVGDEVSIESSSRGDRLIVGTGIVLSNIGAIYADKYSLMTGAGDYDFKVGTIIKTSWFKSFRAAVQYTSDDAVNLTLNVTEPHTVDNDMTVAAHQVLDVDHGALISVNGGKILTINSRIKNGPYQIFAGVGTVVLTTYPQERLWFAEAQRTVVTNITATSAISTNLTLDSKVITFPATPNQMLKASATGLPIDATNTDAQLSNTVTKTHTQGTDQGLDTGGASATTAANVKDAVDKKHTQNSDTYLNQSGANEVTATAAKFVVDNNIYYPDYNEADQGATGSGKSVKAYIDTITTDSATFKFRNNSGAATTTYTFSTDETIPVNINVIIEKGAILSIDGGDTLTVNSPFSIGLYQVFSGDGSVVFGYGNVAMVYPQWWGALGDGSHDDSAAFSSAVDAIQGSSSPSGVIFVPAGTYVITSTITVDATGAKNISFCGTGMKSILVWEGANDGIILKYRNGSNSAMATVEKLQFLNGIKESDTVLHGVIGLQIGLPLGGNDGTHGTCNITVRKNQFQYCEVPIEIWNESDQVTIDDNFIFVFTGVGIYSRFDPACVSGCANSIMRVTNNLLMGGQDGSVGVWVKGANVEVSSNTIQSSNDATSIYLNSCSGFSVRNNYTESAGGATESFVKVVASNVGYIGENENGAYPGSHIINIDATSHDIMIGPNFHAQSGGVILSLINVTAGATGISVLGVQDTDGAVTTVNGTTSIRVLSGGEVVNPSQSSFLACASAQANVTGDSTVYTPIFATEIFDQNADFDGTSTFTAPVTGKYEFKAVIYFNETAAAHVVYFVDFVTSNRTYHMNRTFGAGANPFVGNLQLEFSILADMDTADTCHVSVVVGGSTKTIDVHGDGTPGYTFFSGCLVH